MITRKKLLLCTVGIGLSMASYAQKEVINNYMAAMGDNALIYNGELDKIYAPTIYFNRPYMESEEYFPGEMIYNRNWYGNLNLRFDLYLEQLIALSPEKKVGIDLDMRKITEFTVNKRKFLLYTGLPAGVPEDGYIHVLFDSNELKFLVKHKCMYKASVLRENISYASFEFKDRYYVYAKGTYSSVRKKSQLYKLFPQYKKQLKHFIRERELDFKNDRERSFYLVAEYLQSLITQTGE